VLLNSLVSKPKVLVALVFVPLSCVLASFFTVVAVVDPTFGDLVVNAALCWHKEQANSRQVKTFILTKWLFDKD
jgi:hypothetical protein